MVPKPLALVGLSVGAMLALASCRRSEETAAAPPPPPEVTVYTVAPQTVPMTYEFVAQTAASKTVELRSRIEGFLLHRGYEEGGLVKEGDVLFQIDPRPFQADLEIARARLEQAQARLGLIQRDVARLEDLAARQAATVKEVDDKKTEEIEGRASVHLAEAEVAKAELDLSYTEILSPLFGRVGKSMKDAGSYVDAGANSLLAIAIQYDPIYVYFSISEREYLRWKTESESGRIKGPEPGTVPVQISLLDGTKYDRLGRIDFSDTQIDPATGTVMVRAEFPNADEALKPGQYGKAAILGWERPDAIVVPQRSVIIAPGGASVFVVDDDGTAEMRRVTLGNWKGEGWMVESGLAPGDMVIVDGLPLVRPGAPVRVGGEADGLAPATPPAPGEGR